MENNPNCAETHADFRVGSDDLDPIMLSKELGIEASITRVKGQVIKGARTTYRARTGVWILCSEEKINLHNLEAQILFLLDQLEPKADIVRQLSKRAQVDFHCYWMSSTGYGGHKFHGRLFVGYRLLS